MAPVCQTSDTLRCHSYQASARTRDTNVALHTARSGAVNLSFVQSHFAHAKILALTNTNGLTCTNGHVIVSHPSIRFGSSNVRNHNE